MAVLPIRVLGDPILRTPADPVRTFDRELHRLVADMLETVDAPGRAGLAAPQVGVGLRIFTYNVDGLLGHLINPSIAVSDEPQEDDEGCLSIPGLWFPTPRANHAVATGVDQHGEPLTIEGTGMLARCLQHEVDHLDGILYLNRLSGRERKRALRAVREAELAGRW
jgi:peptide deformylase